MGEGGDVAVETGTYLDSWNGGRNRERGNYLTVWHRTGGTGMVAHDVSVAEPAPRRR